MSVLRRPFLRRRMERDLSNIEAELSRTVFDSAALADLESRRQAILDDLRRIGVDGEEISSVSALENYSTHDDGVAASGEDEAHMREAPADPSSALLEMLEQARSEREDAERELEFARRALMEADQAESASAGDMDGMRQRLERLESSLASTAGLAAVPDDLQAAIEGLARVEAAARDEGDESYADDVRSRQERILMESASLKESLEQESERRAALEEELRVARKAIERMAESYTESSAVTFSSPYLSAEDRQSRRRAGPIGALRRLTSRGATSGGSQEEEVAVSAAEGDASEGSVEPRPDAAEAGSGPGPVEPAGSVSPDAQPPEAADLEPRTDVPEAGSGPGPVEPAGSVSPDAQPPEAADEKLPSTSPDATQGSSLEEEVSAAAYPATDYPPYDPALDDAVPDEGVSSYTYEQDEGRPPADDPVTTPGLLSGILEARRAARRIRASEQEEDALGAHSIDMDPERDGPSGSLPATGRMSRRERALARRELIAELVAAESASVEEGLATYVTLPPGADPHLDDPGPSRVAPPRPSSRAERIQQRRLEVASRIAFVEQESSRPEDRTDPSLEKQPRRRTEGDMPSRTEVEEVLLESLPQASEKQATWVSGVPDETLARLMDSDLEAVSAILAQMEQAAEDEQTMSELVAQLSELEESVRSRTRFVFSFSPSEVHHSGTAVQEAEEGSFDDDRDDSPAGRTAPDDERSIRRKERRKARARKQMQRARRRTARARARGAEKAAALGSSMPQPEDDAASIGYVRTYLIRARARREAEAAEKEQQKKERAVAAGSGDSLKQQRREERDLRRKAREAERAERMQVRAARREEDASGTEGSRSFSSGRSASRSASRELRRQEKDRKRQLREFEQEAARMRKAADDEVDEARRRKVNSEIERLKGDAGRIKNQARDVRRQERENRRGEAQRIKMMRHQAKLDAATQRRAALSAQESAIRAAEAEKAEAASKARRKETQAPTESNLTPSYAWTAEAGTTSTARSTRVVAPSDYDLPEGLPERL